LIQNFIIHDSMTEIDIDCTISHSGIGTQIKNLHNIIKIVN